MGDAGLVTDVLLSSLDTPGFEVSPSEHVSRLMCGGTFVDGSFVLVEWSSNMKSITGNWKMKELMPATTPRLAY